MTYSSNREASVAKIEETSQNGLTLQLEIRSNLFGPANRLVKSGTCGPHAET